MEKGKENTMKYQWTDWIDHVPGQHLLPGMHIMIEEVGHIGTKGKPETQEGTLTTKSANAPHWDMVDEFGKYTMITRYKIRTVADEHEQTTEVESLIDA